MYILCVLDYVLLHRREKISKHALVMYAVFKSLSNTKQTRRISARVVWHLRTVFRVNVLRSADGARRISSNTLPEKC